MSNVKATSPTIGAVSNAVQIGIEVVTFIMVNDAVALVLTAFDILLPASVAGLLILLLALLVSPCDHLAAFLKVRLDLDRFFLLWMAAGRRSANALVPDVIRPSAG